MKPKRIKDPELLAYIRAELFCIVCGAPHPDPHHVKTKGAGGDDVASNLMPLCSKHHREWHQIGKVTFARRYHGARRWLQAANEGGSDASS